MCDKEVSVKFIGKSATAVSGSMVLVEYENQRLMIEAGATQDSNMRDNFIDNQKMIERAKPSTLNAVQIQHIHHDHIGLLPGLVANGFNGKIYLPKNSKNILRDMLTDGAYLTGRTAHCLSSNKHTYDALYTQSDVNKTMDMCIEISDNGKHEILDGVSVELFNSGHILNAKQALLRFENGMNTKKILYTSDLGELKSNSHFTKELERINHADVVISESTYCDEDRKDIARNRGGDLEKLKTECNEANKCLIPSFSLSRSQNLLVDLYLLFKDDDNFNKRIIVDSPLTNKVFKHYINILEKQGRDKKHNLLDDAMNWDRVKFTQNVQESKSLISKNEQQIIISSAGMLSGGRSVYWAKSLIERSDCTIMFAGYQSPRTLGYKIKNYNKMKIEIDDIIYDFNVNIESVTSYSSHIQYYSLIEYLTDIKTNKVFLHHGNLSNKEKFAKVLQSEYRENGKSTRVIPTRNGTEFTL